MLPIDSANSISVSARDGGDVTGRDRHICPGAVKPNLMVPACKKIAIVDKDLDAS